MVTENLYRKRGLQVLLFLFVVVACFLISNSTAYAAEVEIIAEEVVYMETPEYIVVTDSPSASTYKYYIDENGDLCIKDKDGYIIAKECSGNDTSKKIYVYTPSSSSGELIQMTNDNGMPMMVKLV